MRIALLTNLYYPGTSSVQDNANSEFGKSPGAKMTAPQAGPMTAPQAGPMTTPQAGPTTAPQAVLMS
jgi:hypothetical protein